MAESIQGVPGAQVITPGNGQELVEVFAGAVKAVMTTQAIANLAGAGTARVITALSTAGAGTITAAGIVGGITSRAGTQSNTAFTDTTATGTLIDAALNSPQVGQSWEWTYRNTTDANATLTGGTDVTVSGITVVPGGAQARFLVTRTAAHTYTIVGILQTDPSSASGTFVCNGTTAVTVADTRLTANSVVIATIKTAGGTVGAVPAVKTVTPGTGFTIAGTASDTSTYNYLILG